MEVLESKEILASYTTVMFWGGWAERLLAQFSDAGISAVSMCNYYGIDREGEVLINSLKTD